MTTFEAFYNRMKILRKVRAGLIDAYAESGEIDEKLVSKLRFIHHSLKSLQKVNDSFVLETTNHELIPIELDYELNEFEKDEQFFYYGINGLEDYLSKSNRNFQKEIDEGLAFLEDVSFDYFFTDRDGTISNYCGRYLSSVQGVSNALLLMRISKSIINSSIILTAAPLVNEGLEEVSILPFKDYILAGSKGREIIDKNGKYHSFPITLEKQKILDQVYSMIHTVQYS